MDTLTEIANRELTRHMGAIRSLCKVYGVHRLYVFGSVLGSDFAHDSDIDFLVEFDRSRERGAFRQFFDFKYALESVLGRPVDLVCARSMRNPFFKRSVEASKRLVYAQ